MLLLWYWWTRRGTFMLYYNIITYLVIICMRELLLFISPELHQNIYNRTNAEFWNFVEVNICYMKCVDGWWLFSGCASYCSSCETGYEQYFVSHLSWETTASCCFRRAFPRELTRRNGTHHIFCGCLDHSYRAFSAGVYNSGSLCISYRERVALGAYEIGQCRSEFI